MEGSPRIPPLRGRDARFPCRTPRFLDSGSRWLHRGTNGSSRLTRLLRRLVNGWRRVVHGLDLRTCCASRGANRARRDANRPYRGVNRAHPGANLPRTGANRAHRGANLLSTGSNRAYRGANRASAESNRADPGADRMGLHGGHADPGWICPSPGARNARRWRNRPRTQPTNCPGGSNRPEPPTDLLSATASGATLASPMNNDEYEQRKHALEQMYQADLAMVRAAHETRLRCLETLRHAPAPPGDGPAGHQENSPVSPPPPSPPAPAPASTFARQRARTQNPDLKEAVLAALPSLPTLFKKDDVVRAISFAPSRSSLQRVLMQLDTEKVIRFEEISDGRNPTIYRKL